MERRSSASHVPQGTTDDELLVRSLALGLPVGHRIEEHRHDWHQLVFATRGVLRVETERGTWVVPPERAVWIPAGFEHSVAARGRVRMKALYVRPGDETELPSNCCVLPVSPLLRELVLEVVQLGALVASQPSDRRLAGVLRDQLQESSELPLRLPWPTDERARRVARSVVDALAGSEALEGLVAGCGASARTVERLFLRETGLTFGAWRRRAKILGALELLATGASVTEAGLEVGYDSTSAFIAMFKRELGATPGAYASGGHAAGPPASPAEEGAAEEPPPA